MESLFLKIRDTQDDSLKVLNQLEVIQLNLQQVDISLGYDLDGYEEQEYPVLRLDEWEDVYLYLEVESEINKVIRDLENMVEVLRTETHESIGGEVVCIPEYHVVEFDDKKAKIKVNWKEI